MSAQAELFQVDRSALQVRSAEFLMALFAGPARPSARELLRALERAVGHDAGAVFEQILDQLAEGQSLRRADRAYLRAILSDGSVQAALRGKRETDDEAVSSVDALLRESALYRNSSQFKEMVSFLGRFRDYAPYNVMLVRLQNPSCSFFATARDWRDKHGRRLVEDARPMIILAPMHPVMLVYDLDQTDGPALPSELVQFAHFMGQWDSRWLSNLLTNAERHRLRVEVKPLSTSNAGVAMTQPGDRAWKARIVLHDELDEPSRFGVLAHEMAHILLGHLGNDADQWWPGRFNLDRSAAEIEAEAVAHLVTTRMGLKGSSAAYVSRYIGEGAIPNTVSLDLIAKVAGKLEQMAKGLVPAPRPRKTKEAGSTR